MTTLLERLQSALADRYVIEREVGRGGMANVYVAHDVRHERAVAVKVLRPELGVLLGAERFLREIRVVARLQHPHILPVHDSGEAEGALYYVMPYVDGDSLRDRLHKERLLSIAEAVRIACDVADALDLAHRRGVIHRDIKPGNILFLDGHAVVADFGIARAVYAAGGEMWETITDSGVAVGTPAYMSPEQSIGAGNLDARADIYSLGCVLYEMLVGEPPFIGPGGELLIAKRFAEDAPRVSATRADVPPEVDAAVAKALARAPEDRFASARELMDALSATGPTRETGVHQPRSTAPRPVALAVGSAVIAAAAMFVWLTREPRDGRAPTATDTATGVIAAPTPSAATPPQAAAALPAGPDSIAPRTASGGAKNPRDTVPRVPSAKASSPARSERAATGAGDTAVRAEPVRLDSIFQSVAASAQDVRRRAALAGATADELARGDSLFAAARALAGRGRWSEAMQGISAVTSSWMDAQRVAGSRRAADSQIARVPAVQPPAPSPPAAPPPREVAPPADPRVELDTVVARYARALESRSLSELQSAYPGLTTAQRQSWEQFFRNVQDMRASLTIDELQVTGDVASARILGQYRYVTGNARRQETQPVAFHATFRRESGSWRLTAVTQ